MIMKDGFKQTDGCRGVRNNERERERGESVRGREREGGREGV